jgi:uncharacterized protein YjbI with pentapeptide repeats
MSKIKIEIKSWLTGSVLFEYEKECNTIKDTLVEAVKNGANLEFANLSRAYLKGTDLRGANLEGTDLSRANLIVADLRSTDLSGANLSGANLSGTDLRSTDLRRANLRSTDLRRANLSGTYLEGADLRGTDLRRANLSGTYLEGADLRGADLEPIKKDFFDVLLRAIPEINNLKNALLAGKIDGSTYDGECACLCGTLEKSNIPKIKEKMRDIRDSDRPIERFFLGIKPRDTPKNNQFSKLALEWIEEFEGFIKTPLEV